MVRGLISQEGLPRRAEAAQAMNRLVHLCQTSGLGPVLPPLRRIFTLPLQNRILRFEIVYVCREKGEREEGEEGGFLAPGRTQSTLLSSEALPPNLADGELNTNLVTSLRRKVPGEIFDREVVSYPVAAFFPSPFFFLNIHYASTVSLTDCYLMASNRGTFPLGKLYPGENRIGFPDKVIDGLEGHPFYTPTLEEWGGPTPSAQTFAQNLSLLLVPVQGDNRHRPSMGDIAMVRFVNLADSFKFTSLADYLSAVHKQMGIDFFSFLNYPK